MLSRGQWMLIFDTMPNIVQDCILNEKMMVPFFSGTFNWFFSTIYELPLILTFSENILFASFHFWPTVRSGLCHRKSVRPSVRL